MVKTIIVCITIIVVCITTIIFAKLHNNRGGADSIGDKLQGAGERNSDAKQAIADAESGTQESIETARRISELIDSSSRIIRKIRGE